MMTIRNTRDLRFWYEYLRLQDDLPLINEALVKEVKQKIRAYTNAPMDETRYFDTDYDGVTLLLPLPEGLKNAEAATEYFLDTLYIDFVPGPYDCTGRSFTSWFKLVQAGSRFSGGAIGSGPITESDATYKEKSPMTAYDENDYPFPAFPADYDPEEDESDDS